MFRLFTQKISVHDPCKHYDLLGSIQLDCSTTVHGRETCTVEQSYHDHTTIHACIP